MSRLCLTQVAMLGVHVMGWGAGSLVCGYIFTESGEPCVWLHIH